MKENVLLNLNPIRRAVSKCSFVCPLETASKLDLMAREVSGRGKACH
jgi:hypothetical protein